jgi:hypothetical protein
MSLRITVATWNTQSPPMPLHVKCSYDGAGNLTVFYAVEQGGTWVKKPDTLPIGTLPAPSFNEQFDPNPRPVGVFVQNADASQTAGVQVREIP